MRQVVLVVALLFIGIFAFLTIRVIAEYGFDVPVGFSILVLALFSFGIVGALLNPPDD